jgi:hypothetical protein
MERQSALPTKADLTLGANDVGSYFENGNGVRQSE